MKLKKLLNHNSAARIPSHFLALLICCAAGFLAGRILYRGIGACSVASLASFLQSYAQLAANASITPASVLQICITHFRYPVLLFFFAFSALGMYLIPALCFVQGTFLSFALFSFSGALGRSGIQFAFAAFGLRCLFLLPCCLYLASYALRQAADMDRNRGPRKKQGTCGYSIWRPAMICFLILCLGIVAELTIVPKLFQTILSGLM